MKKPCIFKMGVIFLISFSIHLSTNNLFAQSPESFNYQAVVRDASGEVIANQLVNFRISILEGGTSGSEVFAETHTITTSTFGLANLKIGMGTSLSGTFGSIKWGGNTHYLKVEVDPSGGINFINMGTSQLLSVPYALHAKTVENDLVDDADADPANEIQTISLSDRQLTLTKDGGTITLPADSLWQTITEGIAYDELGFVGIGTSNPIAKLDVQGQIKITDGSEGVGKVLTSDVTGLASWETPDTGGESQWTAVGNNIYNSNSGFVGIGTETPYSRLTLGGTGSELSFGDAATGAESYISWRQAGNDLLASIAYNGTNASLSFANEAIGGDILINARDMIDFQSDGGSLMTILNNGNVGIGYTNPGAKLDVGGQIKITDGSEGVGKVLTSDATGLASWETPETGGESQWTAVGNNIYNNNSGFLGIGTEAPYSRLTLGGTGSELSFGDAATGAESYISWRQAGNDLLASIAYNGTNTSLSFANEAIGGDILINARDMIDFQSDGGSIMTILNNGNVGIGYTNPGAKLDVGGQIKITDGSEGVGKVLTSNATGLASWETPDTGSDSPWQTVADGIAYDDSGFVGIGTSNPIARLDVGGQIKITDGSEGVGKVLTSNATGLASWQTPDTGSDSPWQTVADGIAYDDSGFVGIGTTAPLTDLHVTGDDGIIVQGTYGSGAEQNLGAGTRMHFYPLRGAFRAGRVEGDQWNHENIGAYSIALGSSTTASGNISTAMGGVTTASGFYSTAMGVRSTASGDISTAMGSYTTASGKYSTAMGDRTNAESFCSTSIGTYNVGGGDAYSWIDTDPIFEIGIGQFSARVNAITVLKNGNVGIGSANPASVLTIEKSNADILFENGAGSHLIWKEGTATNKAWLGYNGNHINIDNFETGGDILIDAKDAIYFQSDNSTKMAIKNNGDIGIGMSNPDSDLHLKQSGTGFTSGLRLERSNNSDWWSIQTNHNSDLVFDFNGTDTRAWLDDTSAGFHNISDRRLKQDISMIETVLNKIMQLEPVTYRFKSNPNTEILSYGLIAQDVQKVFPEFVSENNGKLGLAYYNFGVISIRAIQEQQEMIVDQQAQIDQLKDEKSALLAEFETFKIQSQDMISRLEKLEALIVPVPSK